MQSTFSLVHVCRYMLYVEEAVNSLRWRNVIITLAGATALFTASACATDDTADKAYVQAKSACESKPADQRKSCLNAASQKYQSDIAKQNVSSCPKSTC